MPVRGSAAGTALGGSAICGGVVGAGEAGGWGLGWLLTTTGASVTAFAFMSYVAPANHQTPVPGAVAHPRSRRTQQHYTPKIGLSRVYGKGFEWVRGNRHGPAASVPGRVIARARGLLCPLSYPRGVPDALLPRGRDSNPHPCLSRK